MDMYSVKDAAQLLGVSDDTIRRLIDDGVLESERDGKRVLVDGASLAACAQDRAATLSLTPAAGSIRNSLLGLVTRVTCDEVMAQVELQCGPYRVVSLVSAESVRELGLRVGSRAWAQVKATNVSLLKA